jgi:hypothetical protein
MKPEHALSSVDATGFTADSGTAGHGGNEIAERMLQLSGKALRQVDERFKIKIESKAGKEIVGQKNIDPEHG